MALYDLRKHHYPRSDIVIECPMCCGTFPIELFILNGECALCEYPFIIQMRGVVEIDPGDTVELQSGQFKGKHAEVSTVDRTRDEIEVVSPEPDSQTVYKFSHDDVRLVHDHEQDQDWDAKPNVGDEPDRDTVPEASVDWLQADKEWTVELVDGPFAGETAVVREVDWAAETMQVAVGDGRLLVTVPFRDVLESPKGEYFHSDILDK
ncbi:hypothetical protein [Natrinema sp. HArc-T2]|uniref:hypothetical protein n=1 Tax=Natrinema sp. HArc-T2 TaxID=3242701 RepID=UPI00359E0F4B